MAKFKIALVVFMASMLLGVRSEERVCSVKEKHCSSMVGENTESDLNDINEETVCFIKDKNCSSKAEKKADADQNITGRFLAGCCDCMTVFKRAVYGTKMDEPNRVYKIVQTDCVEQQFPTDVCSPDPHCYNTDMPYSAEYYTTDDETETAFSLFSGLGTIARCLNQ